MIEICCRFGRPQVDKPVNNGIWLLDTGAAQCFSILTDWDFCLFSLPFSLIHPFRLAISVSSRWFCYIRAYTFEAYFFCSWNQPWKTPSISSNACAHRAHTRLTFSCLFIGIRIFGYDSLAHPMRSAQLRCRLLQYHHHHYYYHMKGSNTKRPSLCVSVCLRNCFLFSVCHAGLCALPDVWSFAQLPYFISPDTYTIYSYI